MTWDLLGNSGRREGAPAVRRLIRVFRGDSPAVLSAPHGGKEIPEELRPYADREERIDLNTDVLVEEIALPGEGFEEYPYFVGGSVVASFRGRRKVAAIMMEVSRGLRLDGDRRKELAAAVAPALAEAVGSRNKVND